MKIHSIGTYIRKSDGVERVYVCFKQEKDVLGGLASSTIMGSLILKEGTTLEEAEEMLDLEKDYSAELMFVPQNDSDFFRVVARA